VPADAEVSVRERPAYVSRGGEKLAAALDGWRIRCEGLVWVDAGCSTGGFTDCLLRHDAAAVHAVDVGVGQIDWALRTDPRVRLREGVNIMSVGRDDLDPPADAAVADLSFRSLRGAARHVLDLTAGGWGIFLVKPQFELRSPTEGFHGVVRDASLVTDIVRELIGDLAAEGLSVEKAMTSPIRGRKGNRELLFLLRRGGAPSELSGILDDLVRE
jgi:23S rRNA (cytidine1920-2'-O)/16S rRNA (cytidine1409-2'-O)-methyltransferase